MLFGRKKSRPAEIARGMREQALSLTAADLNLQPIEARPHVWGAIMELGYAQAVASLCAFADGTVSLYISTGGGIIGAGEQPAVREQAERFLTIMETHVADFERVDDTPPPIPGRVRFYVRTFQATLTAEADEQDLGQNRHKLSPIFHAGHAVITQMRLVSEKKVAK